MSEKSPHTNASRERLRSRQNAARVGWALSAITCLVLLIGVAVIRYTSREDRPSGPIPDELTIETPKPEKRPEPIVLRPTPPETKGDALPRPFAEGFDLTSGRVDEKPEVANRPRLNR